MNDWYECEDRKAGRVKCTDCNNFLEDDKCLEDSSLMPLYRPLHPDRQPSRFVPKNRNTALVLVEAKENKIVLVEEKSYPLKVL